MIYFKKRRLIKIKISLIKDSVKNILYSLGIEKIDYIEIINLNKTTKPFKKNSIYKIFIAYYIRSVRLIDNI